MPANDHLKRLMIETIADNINEMVIGFDSTPATSSDGSAGRPAITIIPTVRIMDNSTLLVEGSLTTADTFDETLKEVFVQLRGTSGFTPITRHVFNPIKKTSTNEVVIQLMIEVK
ncbi:MAG: hypothetical protein CXT67_00580 [Methanobacteriota archaeon]|jgi:hypothetical protein|nr:MAG: hypothetical protein CXT67_00580 [Euryarchaeota archaeon]